ncbi:hypothetical protein [Jannaschia aquimarina]|nr:hypothetical protein [Jannaschia aquimarina]
MACGVLAACQSEERPRVDVFRPDYRGLDASMLDVLDTGGLVRVRAEMGGARDDQDVAAYARCGAVAFGLDRGFGFARHVATNVAERGGIWRADAVYSVSPDLPRGLRTLDAEVVVEDCRTRGIPTV